MEGGFHRKNAAANEPNALLKLKTNNEYSCLIAVRRSYHAIVRSPPVRELAPPLVSFSKG